MPPWLSTLSWIGQNQRPEIAWLGDMFIADHLNQARSLLVLATPDPGLWKGAAAASFEHQVLKLVSELEGIQAQLWG
jgi:hypothetical protein